MMTRHGGAGAMNEMRHIFAPPGFARPDVAYYACSLSAGRCDPGPKVFNSAKSYRASAQVLHPVEIDPLVDCADSDAYEDGDVDGGAESRSRADEFWYLSRLFRRPPSSCCPSDRQPPNPRPLRAMLNRHLSRATRQHHYILLSVRAFNQRDMMGIEFCC